MSLDVTVTDLFCGAGGSSIGAEAAGARLRMAANHWPRAVETHSANFPHADHDCADVSQVSPRRYPRTDILVASPECTNHTNAKARKERETLWGGDPAKLAEEERSRATMWDVPRFAEHHRYQLVVVENVVEARNWAPFPAWLHAMDSLGYDHRPVYLNSMTAHPTPQSRDRMYVVFWRRGSPAPDLDIRPACWCPEHGEVAGVQSWKRPDRKSGKYRAQYLYRCPSCARVALPYAWPAASAIDWAIPAPRIGDRDRPLADATMRRIRAGLDRWGPAAIVQAAGHTYEQGAYYRAWPVTDPLAAQTATAQHALVVETAYAGSADADKSRPMADPLRTMTTLQSQALVTRPAHGVHEPLRTMTGRLTQGLVVPLRNHGTAQPVEAPVPTVAAEGNHHGLLVDYHGGGKAASVDEPHRTMDTRDRYGLVSPRTDVEDCGFRMLEPHEIGRAMAFSDSYTVTGNKRERVRQYGNAVTPPVMAELLRRAIATLGGAA